MRDSIFQKKFHSWRNKLGEKKANIAIGHSLLTVVYAILKEGRRFRESNSRQMHAKERAKRIHHHARRLRQLGSDAASVQLQRPVTCCSISRNLGKQQNVYWGGVL